MTTVERPSMILPADWVPGPEQGSWTYDDYASLPDDGQQYEIVMGRGVALSRKGVHLPRSGSLVPWRSLQEVLFPQEL